jgi:hypothetical protein
LVRIEASAFKGCNLLADVGDISNLEFIGQNAFANCISLQTVSLPVGVTEISANAFTNSGLRTISFANVTKIADKAFKDCSYLTSVDGLQNVEEIDKKAFSGCSELSDIQLGSSLQEIKAKAFEKCTSLTKVTVPDSVQTMGRRVFEGCDSLN